MRRYSADAGLGQHAGKRLNADPRLKTERGYVAVAGVQIFLRARCASECAAGSVPVANGAAELHVGARAAREFNESVLVQRGDSAGGGLAAHPIGFLGEAHGVPAAGCREGSAHPTHARSRHQNIAGDFRQGSAHREGSHRARRVAMQWDLLHIQHGVLSGAESRHGERG